MSMFETGRKRRFPVRTKKCAQQSCRKNFKAYAPSSKYCSPKCRRKDYKIKTGDNIKTIYQRFCKNPDCRKAFKTADGRKKYCNDDCYYNYTKYENRDQKYATHIKDYVSRYDIEYTDLPYCFLCGQRGPDIPKHMVLSHPDVDLDRFYYNREIKLSDMFHEEHYINLTTRFEKNKETFLEQLREYQRSIKEGDDDVF